MTPALYVIGTAISTTILLIAVRNFRRKSGINIRGSYTLTSSIDCDDEFVSSVILENQKDRAITIFGIYLQIGYPYYLELDDFSEAPFVLQPYESFSKEYGPIEFYAVNMKKVSIDSLLKDNSVRKRLVLSTSLGRCVVRKGLNRWNPIIYFFRNSYAATLKPISSTYKETRLGANVRFVVELVFEDGTEQTITIHRRDHEYRRFREFRLTPESLASTKALEEYLESMREQGKLRCKQIRVLDIDDWREQARADYREPKIPLSDVGPFRYFVVGRLHSIYSSWKLRGENRRRAAGHNRSIN